jgi:uncharacterized membrane protein
MSLTRNNLSIACLIFAFLGFLDATYLTILHYKNVFPPCTVTGGCETVLTSQYSIVLGVPVSLLGSLFYLLVIFFALAVFLDKRKVFAHGLFLTALSGLFISAVLFFVQFFILRAFCQYCLLSEIISLAIFVVCSLLYSRFLRAR